MQDIFEYSSKFAKSVKRANFLSSLTTVSFSVRTIYLIRCHSVMSLLRFELFLNFVARLVCVFVFC